MGWIVFLFYFTGFWFVGRKTARAYVKNIGGYDSTEDTLFGMFAGLAAGVFWPLTLLGFLLHKSWLSIKDEDA